MIPQFDAIEGEIHSFNRRGIAFIKQAVGAFLTSLIKPLATTTEALFRQEFGERYFTTWNVLAGAGLIFFSSILEITVSGIIAFLMRRPLMVWQVFNLVSFLLGTIWLVVFLGQSVLHFTHMRERTAKGILWHSYNCGYSRVSEKWQPAYPMVIGIVLMICQIHAPGLLMFLSGLVSLHMRRREAWLFYNRVLDVIDGRIEQENLSEAVLQRSNPQATSGFVAPLPAYVSVPHRNKFLQGMGAQPRPAVGPTVDALPESKTVLAAQDLPARSMQVMQRIENGAESLYKGISLCCQRVLRRFRGLKQ